MIEIRFGSSLKESSRIFAAPTREECDKKLSEFTKGSKYTRQWLEDDYTVVDYGSWSTFYFVGEAKEGEKIMERPTMKDLFNNNYHITELLDKMIENHICFRRYEDYEQEDGTKNELVFYEIIVGYTNVGDDYLIHMVSAENVENADSIRYDMVNLRWIKDVINDFGIDIPNSDQFEVEEEQK